MLNNWKTYKLVELYDISSGLSKSADEFGFGFPFLSFSTVFNNYFIPEKLDQLVNTTIKEQNTCSIKEGDVFLTRTSEVIEELGMSCVALKDYPNATFNGFTKRLRPKNNETVNPLFIGYYLRNIHFRAEISAYSTLTTRASLNNGIIEKLKVNLPSLPIQQKIASILSAYDELIENNKQRIKLLEEMAEEIYKEWFVRLRFPGYENTKIVDGLPKGWERKGVFELSNVTYGFPFNSSKFTEEIVGIPIIRIRDIRNNFSKTFSTEQTDEKYYIENGDLLVGMDGDFHVGIWAGNKAYLNQRVVRFRPNKGVSKYFMFWSFKKQIDFLDKIITGTTVAHLSDKDLKKIKIITPSNEIMKSFGDITDSIYELRIQLTLKNQLLQETRDLLLPRLISGKLSVEHLVEKEEALAMVAEPRAEYK